MKILIASFLMLVFIGFTNKVNAQKFQFYDDLSKGSTVSERFTYDDSNKLQKISYSKDNKWNDFAIVSATNLGEKNENEIQYTVKDSYGTVFTILYFPKEDSVKVTTEGLDWPWILHRRKIDLTNKVNAEKFYVFDGSAFNLMLTCDDSNSVQKISFSADNKWNDFVIISGISLGEKNGNEILYTVQDLSKNAYTVIYFPNQDNIKVTNSMTDQIWWLNRRKN